MTTELTPVFNPPHPIRLLTPGAQQIAIALTARALNTPSYIADVFVQWSPHCNSFSVDVHAGGWVCHTSPDFKEPARFNFSLDQKAEYLETSYNAVIALLDRLEAEAASNPEREKLIAATKAAELRAQAEKLLSESEALDPVTAS